jgi:hypothetical protein
MEVIFIVIAFFAFTVIVIYALATIGGKQESGDDHMPIKQNHDEFPYI